MHAVQMQCLYLSPAKDIRRLSTMADIDIRQMYVGLQRTRPVVGRLQIITDKNFEFNFIHSSQIQSSTHVCYNESFLIDFENISFFITLSHRGNEFKPFNINKSKHGRQMKKIN